VARAQAWQQLCCTVAMVLQEICDADIGMHARPRSQADRHNYEILCQAHGTVTFLTVRK